MLIVMMHMGIDSDFLIEIVLSLSHTIFQCQIYLSRYKENKHIKSANFKKENVPKRNEEMELQRG